MLEKNLQSNEYYKMVCLREIARDPDFKPNTFDDVFKVWASKGLKRFYQIYGDNEMETFESIRKKYVLEWTLFYKYLQIRSYLKDEIKIKYLNDIHSLLCFMIKVSKMNRVDNLIGRINNIFKEIKDTGFYNIKKGKLN